MRPLDPPPATGVDEDAREDAHERVPTTTPEADQGLPVTEANGQRVLYPVRDQIVEVVSQLRDEGYVMCVDVCGVDYLDLTADRGLPEGVVPERFEVVYSLVDHTGRRRIRLRVQVPDDDATLPSIFMIHPGTSAMERETYDMFGVVFEGHPDLTRILMPDDWDGHPLRKDFEVGRIPVQFKQAPSAR